LIKVIRTLEYQLRLSARNQLVHFLSLFSEIIQIFRRDEASFSLLVHRALILSLITLHYIILKHFSIIIYIS
jgi:hypothetical protein